jgi:hypothetical protein
MFKKKNKKKAAIKILPLYCVKQILCLRCYVRCKGAVGQYASRDRQPLTAKLNQGTQRALASRISQYPATRHFSQQLQ